MVLVQKWPFFQHFFLGNIGQENVFDDILERKSIFLSYKNKKFKQLKNWHFFKGVNALFWSKNGHVSKFFFLGNIVQENLFDDIVDRKNVFISYENKIMKNSKNWHFSKGVNPWFWSKNGHFSNILFLGNIGQVNIFDDILEQRNSFLSYKNKKFKSRKIDIFPKGLTRSFGPEIAIFRTFFFQPI